MNTTTNEALLKKIDEAPLLMSKEAAKKKLRKPRSIYGDQILFMLAITVIATCFYGMRVVAVCACSVLACILTDMVGCFLSKKEYGVKDLSTIAYGMALALSFPASVEYYVVIIGAVLAITVKHIFGGKDNYIFNPAGGCDSVSYNLLSDTGADVSPAWRSSGNIRRYGNACKRNREQFYKERRNAVTDSA